LFLNKLLLLFLADTQTITNGEYSILGPSKERDPEGVARTKAQTSIKQK
jgi:hypothetical protein